MESDAAMRAIRESPLRHNHIAKLQFIKKAKPRIGLAFS
jgi:hypothetical protein